MSTGTGSEPEGSQPHEGIYPAAQVYLGLQTVGIAIASACVVTRFIQQKRSWGIWWDDWASLVALVFCFGLYITTILYVTIGRAGYHLSTFTNDQFELFNKLDIALEPLYSASVSMSKYSLLLYYSRIFSSPSRSRLYIYILSILVAVYWLSSLFGVIFTYIPVEAQWKPWLPHTGIDVKAFYVSLSIIDTLLDVAILAYPQTKVWKLQASTRQKALLSSAFLLGAFVCIASILRAIYFAGLVLEDLTYSISPAFLWTVLEADLSVVCSCLPIVYSFAKTSRVSTKSKSTGNSSSGYAHMPKESLSHQDQKRLNDSSEIPLATRDFHAMIESEEQGHHQRLGQYPNHPKQVYVRRDFTVTQGY